LTVVVCILTLFSYTNANSFDPSLNLLGHWTFDNDTETEIIDSSGNNNNGTVILDPIQKISGKIGSGALSFKENNKISLANSIDVHTDNTISVWIKGRDGNGPSGTILAVDNTGSAYQVRGYMLRTDVADPSGTNNDVSYHDGSSDTTFENVDLSGDEWIHLAISRDANGLKFYKNGTQFGDVLVPFYNTPLLGIKSIGDYLETSDHQLMADIDDLRVYSVTLSAEEITALYEMGNTPPPDDNEDNSGNDNTNSTTTDSGTSTTTDTVTSTTTETVVTQEDSQDNKEEKSTIRTGSRAKRTSGSVLGAFSSFMEQISPVTTSAVQTKCEAYLDGSPIGIGYENKPDQVLKLKAFLNEYIGSNIAMNEKLDAETVKAIKDFQLLFKSDIITPWFKAGKISDEKPTGFAQKMTIHKINSIICPNLSSSTPLAI
jgi:hypothetical protein